MITKKNKIYLFFFGCVIIRTLFVIISKKIDQNKLPYLGLLALIPAIGFTYSYIRDNKVGAFGGRAWWHNLRIIHSLTYLLFAIYALQKKKFSYMVLAFDLLFGILAFINHYFIKIV